MFVFLAFFYASFIHLHPLSGPSGKELSHWICALVPCLGDHKISLDEKDSWMEKYRNIFLPLDAIHAHMDWVEYYMSHMESSCKKNYAHDQWKATKKADCKRSC